MAQSEFKRLCFFASLLGWEGLQQFRHRMDADVMLAPGEDPVIRWFECEAMTNLTLQINTAPTYGAAVFAIRFRIASGWYEFKLPSTKREAQFEAE